MSLDYEMSEKENLIIKQGLLEPALKPNDIKIGDTIYLYDMISTEIEALKVTFVNYNSVIAMCCGLYNRWVKIFDNLKQAEMYKEVSKIMQNLTSEEIMKKIMKDFNKFTNIKDLTLGESYTFATTVDHPIAIHKTPSIEEVNEMDRVMRIYKPRNPLVKKGTVVKLKGDA